MESTRTNAEVKALLLRYDARHERTCPQRQQNYWRLRGEYRPSSYGPDRPCNCGLDELLGHHDIRAQG